MTDTTTPPYEYKDDPKVAEYIANMIATAEDGDWRDVLTRVCRRERINYELFHDLLRGDQASYAAGLLHGPEQTFEWIGNGLEGPGALPYCDDEDNYPDPRWFSDQMFRHPTRASDPALVPANCATINEPGTAPATRPRPGITQTCWPLERVQLADGSWWTIGDRVWMLGTDGPDPEAYDRPEFAAPMQAVIDRFNAEEPVPVTRFLPGDLGEMGAARTVVTNADGFEQTELLQRADGDLVAVRPLYLQAVTRNAPSGLGDGYVIEQMGDRYSILRFSTDGIVWGWLPPYRARTEEAS